MPLIGRSMRSVRGVALIGSRDVVAGLVDRVADGRVVGAGAGDGHDLAGEVNVDGADAGDVGDLGGDGRAAVAAGDAGDGVGEGLHVGFLSGAADGLGGGRGV